MNAKFLSLSLLSLAMAGTFVLSGCTEDQSAETQEPVAVQEVGEDAEMAAENSAESMNNAANSMEAAGENMKDAANQAGENMKEGTAGALNETGDAAHNAADHVSGDHHG